jgi:zinc transport system substrate-binding protein
MKKFAIFIFIVLGLITLTACTDSKKADIVTTMFVQYDFAKQIVKDKMTVSLLVPPGAELHNYEPSSKDMVAIKEAKLFIYTSLEIDQWIQNPNTLIGENTILLNLSESYELSEHHHSDEEHTSSNNRLLSKNLELDDHDHEDDDELHYWTDPTTAIQLIEAILVKVIELDPENSEFYENNAHDYIHEIEELHEEMELLFLNELYKDSTLYFAGHNAMSAFGKRYHLHIESLFSDFKPDADLTSQELITFTNQVILSETNYLFIEELVEPKAAEKIKNELKNKHSYELILLELHGYHNVTKNELEENISYLDLLLRNFNNIKISLGIDS